MDWLPVLAFGLSVLIAVAAAVWAVSTVRTTAETTAAVLGTEIRMLRGSIDEFKSEVRSGREDHEQRIRELEFERLRA